MDKTAQRRSDALSTIDRVIIAIEGKNLAKMPKNALSVFDDVAAF